MSLSNRSKSRQVIYLLAVFFGLVAVTRYLGP